jgi:hypothetical protein
MLQLFIAEQWPVCFNGEGLVSGNEEEVFFCFINGLMLYYELVPFAFMDDEDLVTH